MVSVSLCERLITKAWFMWRTQILIARLWRLKTLWSVSILCTYIYIWTKRNTKLHYFFHHNIRMKLLILIHNPKFQRCWFLHYRWWWSKPYNFRQKHIDCKSRIYIYNICFGYVYTEAVYIYMEERINAEPCFEQIWTIAKQYQNNINILQKWIT